MKKKQKASEVVAEFFLMTGDMWDRFENQRRLDKETGGYKGATGADYFEWCSEETILNWEGGKRGSKNI